jgi:hypothetical protein
MVVKLSLIRHIVTPIALGLLSSVPVYFSETPQFTLATFLVTMCLVSYCYTWFDTIEFC